jgi:PAS domain S-box-containing protein
MQEANRLLLDVITEKEEVERELLFTRFAFDHASDSILLFDKNGDVYQANQTAGKLLGYSADELRTITVWDVNPSLTKKEWKKMWTGAYHGKKEVVVSIHQKKDHSVIKVEVSRTFVKFGDRMYFCSIAREQLSDSPDVFGGNVQ